MGSLILWVARGAEQVVVGNWTPFKVAAIVVALVAHLATATQVAQTPMKAKSR